MIGPDSLPPARIVQPARVEESTIGLAGARADALGEAHKPRSVAALSPQPSAARRLGAYANHRRPTDLARASAATEDPRANLKKALDFFFLPLPNPIFWNRLAHSVVSPVSPSLYAS